MRVCHEAGPTGFGLSRRLKKEGIDCIVVAPSLVPQKAGLRVKTDRQFMAFLGLVPSESSSGNSVKRGSLTKTGNGHVRRLLIEAA